ncbi:MAG: hypothetical protein JWR14_159 [Caballeronia sp.]|nr:hypothetical protein [Caballeronia sp.]
MVDTRASSETRYRYECSAIRESVVQNLLIISSVRSEDCMALMHTRNWTIFDVH